MEACMKIGIDIDDTLTDIKDQLYLKGVEFARMLGKTGDFRRQMLIMTLKMIEEYLKKSLVLMIKK